VDTNPWAYEAPEENDTETKPADPDPEPEPAPEGRVNVNTASLEKLQQIAHIGTERAAEIIDLRPFASIDDLTRVTGIGPVRIQDIKDEGIAYVE